MHIERKSVGFFKNIFKSEQQKRKELEKYKSMLDKGLIDKEDYKIKKNQLLAL
tara:strand:+ start:35 stop:193 length:159 start_codon:yes stop_codon:yes gene_type:complete